MEIHVDPLVYQNKYLVLNDFVYARITCRNRPFCFIRELHKMVMSVIFSAMI